MIDRCVSLAGLVFAAMVCAAGCNSASVAPVPPAAAPDFSLTTVDSKPISLSQFKGNVVVLDFWATWCPPCRASLPHLEKLATDPEKKKQGLHVLAINAGEEAAQVQPFLQKNNYTFAVPMDADGQVKGKYNVDGIPSTFVIGRDGTIKAQFVGYDSAEGGAGLDKAVEAALAEKGS